MKTFYTFILLSASIVGYSQEPERKVSSQIKEVTVFLQGAQVLRSASVDLKPGTNTIILNGTSPHVQDNSIQAEINAGAKIVSASFRINHLKDLKQSDASIALDKDRERLNDLISTERTSLEIYTEEENMLKSNKVIGGQQSGTKVDELKVAVEYFRQRMIDIQEHKRQIRAKIDSYQKELTRIDAQLSQMREVAPKPEGEILVKIESKSEQRVQLKVNYLINDASWFPTYDIRAKDIQSPMAITYKANIYQQSGEDWENVKLTVSSANPSVTGAKPVMEPWILGFNNATSRYSLEGRAAGLAINNMVSGRVIDETGVGLPGVNIVIKGTTIGTVTDVNGNYSMALSSGVSNGTLVFSFIGYNTQEVAINGKANVNTQLTVDVQSLSEVVVTGYSTESSDDGFGGGSYRRPAPKIKQTIAATPVVRSTNLEFTIDHPFTIKSGAQNQAVDMIEYEVPAQYEYYAVPKLDTDAFLTARMTDWDNYNFMEGQANIFFEGKYIGKTVLDTHSTGDTLTLSLGRDKNVVVTREKMKEYSSSQFVGSNRKSIFAYEITIRNKKASNVNIRIEDQLPVPNTKEITVDEIEISHAIKNGDKGILTWNFKIQPGKTEKINLKYEVKYPKYQNVILE